MKKYFYVGLIGLVLFEIFNVYFIMPMPGSQRMDSIGIAYFLYSWRWAFRILFAALMIYGYFKSKWRFRWLPFVFVVIGGFIIYFLNFKMSADHMFYQPTRLAMADASKDSTDKQRLVLGVAINGEAKAYPIQYIGYHHQVADTVGGKPVLVTYCTVCRSGRVFDPTVRGKHEKFRLVGMDHFNAMFEDETTGSWWRQATGEAIAGKLKGERLLELLSTQAALGEWLNLYPKSLVMQPDLKFRAIYDSMSNFESGKGKSDLTRSDTLSWEDKSWVVGVKTASQTKAYDWNKLKKERCIQDQIDATPVLVVLAKDDKSFFALERPSASSSIVLQNDTLFLDNHKFKLDGTGIDTSFSLKRLLAYQEFWHSWRCFQPSTLVDK
jgi:Protein of unknown function (DUF3179)